MAARQLRLRVAEKQGLIYFKKGDSIDSPVIITGAGPVGLSLSILLSKAGIPSLTVERQSTCTAHPQAHFINTRTMEIFRSYMAGFDAKVAERCPPLNEWSDFSYCTSVLGREFARRKHFGEDLGHAVSLFRKMSPSFVGHLGQNHLVPLLREKAEEAGASIGAKILYGQEVIGLKQSEDKVQVKVRGQCSGEEATLSASFLVGCDGARSSVRSLMGLPTPQGEVYQHLMNLHFTWKPDESEKLSHPAMLYFVFNKDVIAVLIAHNVSRGEWVAQVPYFPPYQTPEMFTESYCEEILRKAFYGPRSGQDLGKRFSIHSKQSWRMTADVAADYVNDRIIIAGDAAHQFPPAGGFGMNTGIQDVHNLYWKLALVLQNKFPRSLLRTYEVERRQIAKENTSLSLKNYERNSRVPRALGVDPDMAGLLMKTMSSSVMAFLPFGAQQAMVQQTLSLGASQLDWLDSDDSFIGNSRRALARTLVNNRESLGMLDLGFRYSAPGSFIDASAALRKDEEEFYSRKALSDAVMREDKLIGGRGGYHFFSSPGARLPHLMVQVLNKAVSRKDGQLSTLDLPVSFASPVSFVLLSTLENGHKLLEAAAELKRVLPNLELPLSVALLASCQDQFAGHNLFVGEDGTREDVLIAVPLNEGEQNVWEGTLGAEEGSVLFIRPDGHVLSRGRWGAGSLTLANPASVFLSGNMLKSNIEVDLQVTENNQGNQELPLAARRRSRSRSLPGGERHIWRLL